MSNDVIELLEILHDEMLDIPCVGSTNNCELVDWQVKLGDVLEVFNQRLNPTATPNEDER